MEDKNVTTPVVQPAEFQLLYQAIGNCAAPAVQQMVLADPKWLHHKSWNDHTVLHKACLGGDWTILYILLEAGADPNAANCNGETCFHYACKRGLASTVHLMLRYRADIKAFDNVGRGVTHHAAQAGSVFVLHYLSTVVGVSLHDQDHNLQTPFHIICQFGHQDAYKYFMRNSLCNLSLPDVDGNTPLHIAVREGYCFLTWMLLTDGGCSQLHRKNNDGDRPLDLAVKKNKSSHVDFLPLLRQLTESKDKTGKPRGPVLKWYWLLCMSTVLYGAIVVACLLVGDRWQGVVATVGMVYLLYSFISLQHRMTNIGRWPNPVFAGAFAGGLIHTSLAYFLNILPRISDETGWMWVTVISGTTVIYLYIRLLFSDPGLVKESIRHPTGATMKLVDLVVPPMKLEAFCVVCEIVRVPRSRHCKLCECCYSNMDHHCLFLMKCIAGNNHTRFFWFILMCLLTMFLFLGNVVVYCLTVYRGLGLFQFLEAIFHSNAWLITSTLLNMLSVVWGVNLVRYQVAQVSRGFTTVYRPTHDESTLTNVERMLNTWYFIIGKEPFVVDPIGVGP